MALFEMKRFEKSKSVCDLAIAKIGKKPEIVGLLKKIGKYKSISQNNKAIMRHNRLLSQNTMKYAFSVFMSQSLLGDQAANVLNFCFLEEEKLAGPDESTKKEDHSGHKKMPTKPAAKSASAYVLSYHR